MGRAIAVTRTEHVASDLRIQASRCRDGAQVRRLLALALILEGHTRTEAAKRSGMERQTLRDWVHRHNATGVAGLKSGHGPGGECQGCCRTHLVTNPAYPPTSCAVSRR